MADPGYGSGHCRAQTRSLLATSGGVSYKTPVPDIT